MILNLTNFRCYSSKRIELPDEGIILLHGTSGIGKTSILKAINFALFGKESKCIRHNEKKCCVELTFKDITIIRTKNPNIVRIEYKGEKFEGPAAEQIITKIYDKYFNITSYVAQKSIESFVQLPLSKKLEFFTHLALKDIDVNVYKEKCKAIVKHRKELLNTKRSEIKVLKNQLETFNIPENIEYPLKSGEYNEAEVEREKRLIRQNNDKLNELLKEQKELQKQLNSLQSLKTQRDKIILEKEFLNKSIIEYKNELENIQDIFPYYNELEDHINIYINYLRSKIKFTEENSEYENFYSNLLINSKKEIDKIKTELNEINFDEEKFNKIKYIFENKDLFENFEKDINKLNIILDKDLEDNINNLLKIKTTIQEELKQTLSTINQTIFDTERKIKNLSRNKFIKCPSCTTDLTIVDDDVKCFSPTFCENLKNDLSTELETMKNNYNKYNYDKEVIDKEIKSIDKVKNALKFVNNYLELLYNNTVNNIINLYLKEKNESEHYKDINKKLERLQLNLKSVEDGTDKTVEYKQSIIKKLKTEYNFYKSKKNNIVCNHIVELNSCLLEYDNEYEPINNITDFDDYDESDMLDILEDVIKIIQKRKSNNENIFNNKVKIENKILECKNKLNLLDESQTEEIEQKIQEINNIESNLEKITTLIEEKTNKKNKLEKRERKLERYLAYRSELDRFKKLEDNIKFCEKEEIAMVESLATSENFYKIILEAETISISNTLENINMNIKYYMDNFFPEGNIQMNLSPFKENKKGDKQTGLDIEIFYNGDKVDLDDLSGGEFDRCLLVLFLSFNSMVSGDLIMLDECLSSVNGELVEDIIEFLKNTLKGKLVLVTLHQANVGIFDYVLDLEK